MRARLVSLLTLLLGCNSSGTQAQPSGDAGGDATLGDASGDAEDASNEDAAEPCVPIVAGNPTPSQDCIFAGSCPADCAQGTSAAYVCNAASAGEAGAYPSAFMAPTGIISIIGYDTTAYPWDAAAWVACGPLTCVRWATADYVDGGSAWPADPCGGDADLPLAWVCPPYPGVLPPPDAGCVNAGDMNVVGGDEAGVPSNTVWCCPGAPPNIDAGPADGASPEASPADGGIEDGD
jgi:hypothetical protein